MVFDKMFNMNSRRGFLKKLNFSAIILNGLQPVVRADGGEALRDMKIIDAIDEVTKIGKKMML